MQALYIIKTGSTFAHIAQELNDFEHWIEQGLIPSHWLAAERPSVVVIDAPNSAQGPLSYPAPEQCIGVVISGSHDMVTEQQPWMQALSEWLYGICHAGIPVLGICFGHQLLAQVLGGQVGTHPSGVEIGTVPVAVQADVTQDPLWHDMPACFEAHAIHYQTVRQLPAQACTIAGNSHEPHHAFRWRDNVWGVQFHPEFSAAAMQAYIAHISHKLTQHGLHDQNPASLRWQCRDTPEAAVLLHNFTRHALSHAHSWPLKAQALAA